MTTKTRTARTTRKDVMAAAAGTCVIVGMRADEFRIAYRIEAIKAANPQLDRKALFTLNESKAAYCTDADEALATLRLMIDNADSWMKCKDTHPDFTQPAPEPAPAVTRTKSQVYAMRNLASALAVTPNQTNAIDAANPYNDQRPYAEQFAALFALVQQWA